jgi:hypothetical protein
MKYNTSFALPSVAYIILAYAARWVSRLLITHYPAYSMTLVCYDHTITTLSPRNPYITTIVTLTSDALRPALCHVTVVSQCCNSGVTVVLQWCYSGVTVVLQCHDSSTHYGGTDNSHSETSQSFLHNVFTVNQKLCNILSATS